MYAVVRALETEYRFVGVLALVTPFVVRTTLESKSRGLVRTLERALYYCMVPSVLSYEGSIVRRSASWQLCMQLSEGLEIGD